MSWMGQLLRETGNYHRLHRNLDKLLIKLNWLPRAKNIISKLWLSSQSAIKGNSFTDTKGILWSFWPLMALWGSFLLSHTTFSLSCVHTKGCICTAMVSHYSIDLQVTGKEEREDCELVNTNTVLVSQYSQLHSLLSICPWPYQSCINLLLMWTQDFLLSLILDWQRVAFIITLATINHQKSIQKTVDTPVILLLNCSLSVRCGIKPHLLFPW